ncbi:PH domain-containing protein [Alteromonas confluentis]|uniref:YdbS-like PH domain-containing protein n=1 Tax=Alteromonas confluentis TaxID=1656094 RepID=A0A1E7Z930_9ALTE|nr:PH domain-containing protein [Alteromonas confluentis]OFC69951.1 hypothetical protein BFC18_15320 [Alteromonas confluentis]
MAENVLFNAQMNPAVKTYWLINLLLISTVTVVGIPLLVLSIPVFFLCAGRVLASISATLTERKLIVKRGVFNKEEKTIPLDKITDVSLVQGPIMRAFNIHKLSFETAGQSGMGALVSLLGVVDAEHFRELILEQKENLAGKPSTPPESDTKQSADTSDLAALTASVQRIEGLLSQLIDAKKRAEQKTG